MKHRTQLLSLLIVLLLIVTSCTPQSAAPAPQTPAEVETPATEVTETPAETVVNVKITGEGVDLTLDQATYDSLEEVSVQTTNVDSKGEVSDVEVTGIVLFDYLSANGVDVEKIAAVNLVADDGYQISVEKAMWEDSELMVITKSDGEAVDMARSALPGKRAMYWVKNLTEIQLDTSAVEENQSDLDTVLVVRELIHEMDDEELNNFGYEVDAYSLRKLFEQFGKVPTQAVKMIAEDGLEKTETADVFLAQYVTFEFEDGTEDNTPLYFSEEISDGMRVKFLKLAVAENQALFFGKEISFQDLFESVGMKKADSYRLVAIDGFSVEVPAEAIEYGKIYVDDDEHLRTVFDGYDLSEVKGKGSVKTISRIEAIGGTTEASGDTGTPLLKVFVGDDRRQVSEEEFLALPQIEKHLSRTNSKGETSEADYSGVHWSELAKALNFDPDTTVTLVASDGYEVVLTSDILNDPDSLFAITQDGAPIESEGDGKVWFCASENFTANYWVKYVAKIVIE